MLPRQSEFLKSAWKKLTKRIPRNEFLLMISFLFMLSYVRDLLVVMVGSKYELRPIVGLLIVLCGYVFWSLGYVLLFTRRLHDLDLTCFSLFTSHPIRLFIENGDDRANRFGVSARSQGGAKFILMMSLSHLMAGYVLLYEDLFVLPQEEQWRLSLIRNSISWSWYPARVLADAWLSFSPDSTMFVSARPFFIFMTIYSFAFCVLCWLAGASCIRLFGRVLRSVRNRTPQPL